MSKLSTLDDPMEVISGWAKEKENPYKVKEPDYDLEAKDMRQWEEENHERDFESFFNTANDQYES